MKVGKIIFWLWIADLIFLAVILALAIPHFLNFCPIKFHSFSELREIPICRGTPTWEGIRSGKVVYAPTLPPSPFSATCPFCRLFPVRLVPNRLEKELPPEELLAKLKSLNLPQRDLHNLIAKRIELHSADDGLTDLAKFHGLIWLGTNYHGLILYDLSAHAFKTLEQFNGADPLHEISAIQSLQPLPDKIIITHDYLCPGFFAVSECAFSQNKIICQRIK